MNKYYMTEKEQQFLTVASVDQTKWDEWVGIDPAYVYFDFNDLLEAGINVKVAEGLLSSLLKKEIVEVEMRYEDMNVFDKGKYLYSFTEKFCKKFGKHQKIGFSKFKRSIFNFFFKFFFNFFFNSIFNFFFFIF